MRARGVLGVAIATTAAAAVVALVSAPAQATDAVVAAPRAAGVAIAAASSPEARMGDYAAAGFAAQAARLPTGLGDAVRSQLGISTAQYLAEGQAAADAGRVVAALRGRGVDVVSSRLDGTRLTVEVGSASDAAAVRAAGARAVVAGTAGAADASAAAAPAAPAGEASALAASTAQKPAVHGGDGWFYYTNTTSYDGIVCSVGFTGYDVASGRSEFVTSGHCDAPAVTGDAPPATPFHPLTSATPGVSATDGSTIGAPVAGTFTFGSGSSADAGLVATDPGHTPEADVTTWGAGASSGAGQYVPVLGETAGVVGAPVCRSGWRSGWQCGTVTGVDVDMLVGGQLENTITTDACALQGDSGGAVMSGGYAVGVLSGGTWPDCSPATIARGGYRSVAFPMVSTAGKASVSALFPNWRIATAGQPAPAGAAATAGATTAASAAAAATKPAKASRPAKASAKPKKLKASTPRIAGSAKTGAVLTAKPGTWTAGVVKRYQWYAGASRIAGATKYRYRIAAKYAGKRIHVVVSGTRSGYAKAVTTSKATAIVLKRR